MIHVILIEHKGAAALVEFKDPHGHPQRATIPAAELTHNEEGFQADPEILAQGIPYGAAWELLPLGRQGAHAIASELHRRGIWTAEDARTHVAQVRAALAHVVAHDLETILNAART